jgi:D-alanyl-D-alanine carboxypeptidase
MLTSRTSLLTIAGLLTSFLATAQTTEPLSPANQDMLSWMLRVLLWAVMLVAALAGIVLTTAAANRKSFAQQPAPGSLPATAPAEVAASAPAAATPVAVPAAPAPTLPISRTALALELAFSE